MTWKTFNQDKPKIGDTIAIYRKCRNPTICTGKYIGWTDSGPYIDDGNGLVYVNGDTPWTYCELKYAKNEKLAQELKLLGGKYFEPFNIKVKYKIESYEDFDNLYNRYGYLVVMDDNTDGIARCVERKLFKAYQRIHKNKDVKKLLKRINNGEE